MPVLVHGEKEAEGRVLRALQLAVELTIVILVIEILGALFSRSLSLTVDAVHNVPDLLAFLVSWLALRATARGASGEMSFGPHRFEVFASLLNAALVLGTGAAFGYLAVLHLFARTPFAGSIDAVWILAAGAPVLVLRAVNLAVLGRMPGRARDLNLHSVLVHIGSDLAITIAVLTAGAILFVDPSLIGADSLAALVIAGICVAQSLPLFRGGWDVLTERTPRDISIAEIERTALAVPRVVGLHDLHVWAVCPTLVCMTAHVRVEEMSVRASMDVVAELRDRMADDFGILHAVFELEADPSPLRPAGAPPHG
jgi:cobalt-zinc-cadmium efflux system protein